MGTLHRDRWSGWSPNNNEVGGDPSQLIRADNLIFDENGTVQLARGCVRASSGNFPSYPYAMYGKTFLASSVGTYGPAAKCRYIASGDSIYRNYASPYFSSADFNAALLQGGDGFSAAFCSGWDNVFAFSGSKKRADPGNSSLWRDLGIPASLSPGVRVNPPPTSKARDMNLGVVTYGQMEGTYKGIGGTANTDNVWYNFAVASDTFRAVVYAESHTFWGQNELGWDTTRFDLGTTGGDDPNDLFHMDIRIQNISKLIKVRVELLLESVTIVPGSNPPSYATTTQDVKNYYFMEWYTDTPVSTSPTYLDPNVFGYSDTASFIDQARAELIPGIEFSSFYTDGKNFWNPIECLRSQFRRVGTDTSKGWNNIIAIRIICQATDVIDFYVSDAMKFIGGSKGLLNGTYSYIQVNCYNGGTYTEQGLDSPTSPDQIAWRSSIHVTPAAVPGNANHVKIFRASTQTPGYYLVWECDAPYAPFDDILSDLDAFRNERKEDYRTALPDNIRTALGPYYDRMIYFDDYNMYPSYQYDPGSYDERFVFKIASADPEAIMWAEKVIDGVLLVGTTSDIYEVTGDFTYDETNEILNVAIHPLGIRQPPVNTAHCVYNNTLFYVAEDGWRYVAGSSSGTISDSIDMLFKGYDRNGIGHINVGTRNSIPCSGVISKGRLVTCMDLTTVDRAILVYTFSRQRWDYWHNDISAANNPYTMGVDEDGTVFFSTISMGDRYIYEWDSGYLVDAGTPNSFTFRTVFDSNGTPNNRKDAFTLKVKADTGGTACIISVRSLSDAGSTLVLNNTLQAFGPTEKFYDIHSGLSPAKRFQVEISGKTATFKLYSFSIEYTDRPTQVNWLRVPPTDFGTAGRKRLPSLPFEIDTLGNTVLFTPILDGVAAQAGTQVSSTDKQVFSHLFNLDTIASSVGANISCATGVFEFYDLVQPREMELLPDPITFKYINTTNFGTTRRKRFGQIAFNIDTKGQQVLFSPYFDGVAAPTMQFSTVGKTTVIYYTASPIVAIDFRATLFSGSVFELYGLNLEDCVYEILPVATKFRTINSNNFGTASKKRVRTIPIVIDTLGSDVVYTPRADGVDLNPAIFNCVGKRTLLYYFDLDVFAIDYGGQLQGSSDFEFYEMLRPEIVEILPVGKRFDQIGPLDFNREARAFALRIRILPEGTSLDVRFFAEDGLVWSDTFTTVANQEQVLEFDFPKGVKATVVRIEFQSTSIFHRFKADLKLSVTGAATDLRWVTLK
jgi:hypothetical protein